MSKLLLNLRHVPDDEADEVRALLDAHRIAYYETRPNRWGISAGGIWLQDPDAADAARRLLADYQRQRQASARAAHAAARAAGTAPTLWTTLRDHPLQVLAAIIAIAFILALSTLPYFLLGD